MARRSPEFIALPLRRLPGLRKFFALTFRSACRLARSARKITGAGYCVAAREGGTLKILRRYRAPAGPPPAA